MKVKLLISELALIEAKAHGIYQRLKEELHYEVEPIIQHYNEIDVALKVVDVENEEGEIIQFFQFHNPLTGNIELYSKKQPIETQLTHKLVKEF